MVFVTLSKCKEFDSLVQKIKRAMSCVCVTHRTVSATHTKAQSFPVEGVTGSLGV